MKRYTLEIEYNGDPAYHPISVLVELNEGTFEWHGKSLQTLLNKAMKWITEQENKEL